MNLLVVNNPFEYVASEECRRAFEELCGRLDELRRGEGLKGEDMDFCRELEAGKMLGVLIAEDKHGVRQTLYAFSGQLGSSGFKREGFVEAVFDYLETGGHFKRHEAEISGLNREIAELERGELTDRLAEYEKLKAVLDAEVEAFREQIKKSKENRMARRSAGSIDDSEAKEMIRQSQFEKAELHRLKKKNKALLSPVKARLDATRACIDALKEKRKEDSENLQKWLFDNFRVLNGRGESKSLSEIFAETPLRIPPSGAGECCGPKLLQAAFVRGWKPLEIAEYWYGAPKGGEVRRHGEHYPACRGKCLPVLSWMLQGLEVNPPMDDMERQQTFLQPEIVYEGKWFCVVNKPSGMLSVPGKGNQRSVEEWLTETYGNDREVRMAHRLDQDTSGLIIATFGREAYKEMQRLFATRKVSKTYIADLSGDYIARSIAEKGRVTLPLSADWLDRPRQRVDFEEGKEAITEYEFTGVCEGRSRVIFRPLTGRTHQLRMHAASEHGLGMPIVGDRLYGSLSSIRSRTRLHLHAGKIEFTFPLDNRHYIFVTALPF